MIAARCRQFVGIGARGSVTAYYPTCHRGGQKKSQSAMFRPDFNEAPKSCDLPPETSDKSYASVRWCFIDTDALVQQDWETLMWSCGWCESSLQVMVRERKFREKLVDKSRSCIPASSRETGSRGPPLTSTCTDAASFSLFLSPYTFHSHH